MDGYLEEFIFMYFLASSTDGSVIQVDTWRRYPLFYLRKKLWHAQRHKRKITLRKELYTILKFYHKYMTSWPDKFPLEFTMRYDISLRFVLDQSHDLMTAYVTPQGGTCTRYTQAMSFH